MRKTRIIADLAEEILQNLDKSKVWCEKTTRENGCRPLYRGHVPRPDEPDWYHEGGTYEYRLYPHEYDTRALRLYMAEKSGKAEFGIDSVWSMTFTRAVQLLVREGKVEPIEPGSKIIRRVVPGKVYPAARPK
jgi:hypothetical protein